MWNVLTPSELVVLYAERFAPSPRPMSPRCEAPLTGVRLSAVHLVVAALTSAMAALQCAGAIEVQVHRRRSLLGLRSVRRLVTFPGQATVTWPECSMEQALAAAAAEGEVEASILVVRALAEDSFDPWNHTIDRILRGLVQRGVIVRDPADAPDGDPPKRYHLTEATHAGIRDEECEDALAALHRFCAREAEVAGMLTDAIRTAMEARSSTVEPQLDETGGDRTC